VFRHRAKGVGTPRGWTFRQKLPRGFPRPRVVLYGREIQVWIAKSEVPPGLRWWGGASTNTSRTRRQLRDAPKTVERSSLVPHREDRPFRGRRSSRGVGTPRGRTFRQKLPRGFPRSETVHGRKRSASREIQVWIAKTEARLRLRAVAKKVTNRLRTEGNLGTHRRRSRDHLWFPTGKTGPFGGAGVLVG